MRLANFSRLALVWGLLQLAPLTLAQTQTSALTPDPRVWSQFYWQQLAARGLVKVTPPAAFVPAPPAVRVATLPGAPSDSRDVPISPRTNLTQSENSLFVHPLEPNTLLNSNNSTAWPVTSVYGSSGFISDDGGRTWRGQAEGTGGNNGGDPATAIDRSGRFFVGYIAANSGQGVAQSLDRGRTWAHVQVALKRDGSVLDKNHLWVDNSVQSPYAGNLYSAWTMFGGASDGEIEFARSTDGGRTWSAPLVVSRNVSAGSHNQGVNIQTGPNGEVYVLWAIYDVFPANEAALGFAVSRDGGVSFAPAQRIRNNIRGIRGNTTLKNIRVAGFPVLAVDVSNSARRGTIYAVWPNQGVPGDNTGNDIDGYLIRSTDNGATWSEPVRINQDPPGLSKQHFFQWITCDAANGNLSVVYYDDRNVGSTLCEVYVSNSSDGGASWTDLRVSDVPFRPAPIPGLATNYFGDYLGIAAYGGKVYPVWTDNRDGRAMTYISPFILLRDSIPPAPIADLRASAPTSNSVTLQWTAAGDDGEAGRASRYDVRYALAPIDSLTFAAATPVVNNLLPQTAGTPESFEVTGLNFNTTYFFAIKSLDEQDNAAALSNLATATTLGAPRLGLSPDSFAVSLLTGARTTRTLTLRNVGEGTLDFKLRRAGTAPWLTFAPDSGRVHAGAALAVQLTCDASGLAGSYDAQILLASNTPAQPEVRVPVHMQVRGAPDLHLATTFLNFDTVFVSDTLTLTLEAANLGNEPLNANLAAPTAFVAEPRAFTLAPGAKTSIAVSFVPTRVGTFIDSLVCTTNDPDEANVRVLLRGVSLPPPEISVTPSRLEASLLVGQTERQRLTIANSGQSALQFQLHFENEQRRAQQLAAPSIIARADWQKELLQHARAATQGIVFPRGRNDEAVQLAPALREKFRAQLAPYAQLVARLRATAALPSLAVGGFNSADLLGALLSMSNSVRDYVYTDIGDNFTLATLQNFDGVIVDERDFRLSLSEAEALRDYAATGKPVFMGMDDFDNLPPNVQSIIFPLFGVSAAFDGDFVFGALNPEHPITQNLTSMEAFNSIDNDYFTLNGAEWLCADASQRYFGVAHLARNRSVLFGESLFAIVANNPNNLLLFSNALDWMMAGNTAWVTVDRTSGTVLPGAQTEITAAFNAVGLRGGEYTVDLMVESDDPDEKRFAVPVRLAVTDAADIVVAHDTLNFGEVFVGARDSLVLEVTNAGSLALQVSSAVAAPNVFSVTPASASIAPSLRKKFTLYFAPTAAGAFSGSLTLTHNDPDANPTQVSLLGTGRMPPTLAVAPEAFAFALNAGDSASATLTLANTGETPLTFALRDIESSGAVASEHYVFWSQEYQDRPDTLFRCNLDGTNVQPIYVANLSTGYSSLAYHPREQRIYAAEFSEGRIFSVKADGSDPRILVTNVPTVFDIVLDLNAGHMYWVQTQSGVIKRANLDGSEVRVVVQSFLPGEAPPSGSYSKAAFFHGNATTFLNSPRALDLDLDARKVYWTEPNAGRIARANLDGSNVETISNSAGSPTAMKLDLAARQIYFVEDNSGNIMRMPLAGGSPEVVLRTAATQIADFKLDVLAQNFYWTDYNTDRMMRATFAGREVTTIITRAANNADGPFALGLTGSSNWLTATPSQGSVAAHSSVPIALQVKTTGLLAGEYRATLFIASNDPRAREKQIPVTLQLTGMPVAEATPDSIDFGETFIGTTQRATFTLRNSGTADLLVSNMQISPAAFVYSDSTRFTLAPRASRELSLSFQPTTAQTFVGTLTFTTNATTSANLRVALRGAGILPAALSTTPDSLFAELELEESATRLLTVHNTGGGILHWTATTDFSSTNIVQQQSPRFIAHPVAAAKLELAALPERPARTNIFSFPLAIGATPRSFAATAPRLDSVLAKMNRNFAPVTSTIPQRFDFSEGESSNRIGDGGSDMYDGGNFISTNYASAITYSNNKIVAHAAFGRTGAFFTRKFPGLFLLVADLDNVNEFIIDGNLGADGTGNVDGAILETTVYGTTYQGFVKRVFNANDPSVNHLLIVARDPAATHAFDTNSDSDFHALRNLSATTRLYYLLYASAHGGYIDNAATLQVMQAFLSALELSPSWLTLTPASGALPAQTAQAVEAQFNTAGLPAGNYAARIQLASNAPVEKSKTVPVHLRVGASAAALVLADSVTGVPRDTVSVPLSLQLNKPVALQKLQAVLKLANAALTFVAFTPASQHAAGWSVHARASDSLLLNYESATGKYLNASGALLTLHFRIANTATPGQSTALRLLQIRASDSTGHARTISGNAGLVLVRKPLEVSGTVKYARLNGAPAQPVAELRAVLARNGSIWQTQNTNSAGQYALREILPRPSYRVELQRTRGGLGAAITPTDALLALNSHLGNVTLTGAQSLAADVDGDLNITLGDAVAIFNRALGRTDRYRVADWRAFPASYALEATPTAWKTTPAGIDYAPLTSDQLNQNYIALARGDVDLNWTPGTNATAETKVAEHNSTAITFGFAPARVEAGSASIIIPLWIAGEALAHGLYAFGGELEFDAQALAIIAVQWSTLVPQPAFHVGYAQLPPPNETEDAQASAAYEHASFVRFGGFSQSAAAIRAGGVLFEIVARVSGNVPLDTALPLRLRAASAALGANEVATQSHTGFAAATVRVAQDQQAVLAAPATFALFDNYPNPFNPSTQLRYQLPEPATVSLTILNALGQKVRTLVFATKQASGYYHLTWDGTNTNGAAVTAGVYFCHFVAHSTNTQFQQTRKMLLLK